MGTFKYHDIAQNTEEWFGLRAGLLTSSKLGVIMANIGKAFGEPAKKYAVNIAIEQITGEPIPSTYTNDHMERGHEQEPIARMLYEAENFTEVSNGGFFGSDFIGCSPDGLVDSNGGVIEIKSVIAPTHYATVKRQGIDPSYKWQCIGNLRFTGRDWLDFISYCADFPEDKRLFVKRIYAENLAEEFELLDSRINEFKALVDSSKKIILESDYSILEE